MRLSEKSMEPRQVLRTSVGDCEEEKSTRHYLGEGFGPVQDGEWLLYAVFEKTPFDAATQKVTKKAFKTSQLTRTEVSVARQSYTPREQFEACVVQPAEKTEGFLRGIARASVLTIRQIPFSVPQPKPNPPIGGRGICVVDKVTSYDFDGHAALGYSEAQDRLTDPQKAKIREFIKADLVNAFEEIVPLEVIFGTPAPSLPAGGDIEEPS